MMALCKTPHGSNRICIILVVVVLAAIAESLIPRVVIIVLRRGPVSECADILLIPANAGTRLPYTGGGQY
jgi:hypothetical protein